MARVGGGAGGAGRAAELVGSACLLRFALLALLRVGGGAGGGGRAAELVGSACLLRFASLVLWRCL